MMCELIMGPRRRFHMKARSTFCYAFTIAMLFISVGVRGEILDDGYWDGDAYGKGGSTGGYWPYSSCSAWADGNDNFSWGFGDGWHTRYTTVTATLNYSWTAYAYVEAYFYPGAGSSGYAYATATASVSLPGLYHVASFDIEAYTETSTPASDVGSASDAKTRTFNAGRGIAGDHSACALASVEYGGGSQAYSHACAHAYGNLW